jgi:hypothetical protein
MKFKLIDRERRGFARYCPTFARGCETMGEAVRKMRRRREIKKLAGALGSTDATVLLGATADLGNAASKGEDITPAIPALVEVLGEEGDVQKNAINALGDALANEGNRTAILKTLEKALCDFKPHYELKTARIIGNAARVLGKALDSLNYKVDITPMIPALAIHLGDDHAFDHQEIVYTLEIAAGKGMDIAPAIPALARKLGSVNNFLRASAAQVLGNIASKGQKTQTLVVNEIIGLMRSDWFQSEMERNSVEYERTATTIAKVLDTVRKTEEAMH